MSSISISGQVATALLPGAAGTMDNPPLPGAHVYQETSNGLVGTTANANGGWSFNCIAGIPIKFSAVGFKTRSLPAPLSEAGYDPLFYYPVVLQPETYEIGEGAEVFGTAPKPASVGLWVAILAALGIAYKFR